MQRLHTADLFGKVSSRHGPVLPASGDLPADLHNPLCRKAPSRRSFLAALLPAAAAALALDPEWLTWRPGARTYVDVGAIRGYGTGVLALVGGPGTCAAFTLPPPTAGMTYTFTDPHGRAWRIVSAWVQVNDGPIETYGPEALAGLEHERPSRRRAGGRQPAG